MFLYSHKYEIYDANNHFSMFVKWKYLLPVHKKIEQSGLCVMLG